MTQSEISAIVIAVSNAMKAAKSGSKPTRKARTYAKKLVVDDKTDAVLRRRSAIGRGFARKGIKVTFVNETGRFENVKPYKVWLSEGRIVMKGQHGVRGLFHISQTSEYVAPVVRNIPADAVVGQTV